MGFIIYNFGGTGFPRGLCNAVYFTLNQSASKDFCIAPPTSYRFGFTQKETPKREGIPTSSKFMVPSSEAAKGNSKPELGTRPAGPALQEIFLDDPSGCSYYPAASDFNGLGGLVKRQAVRQNRALANDCSRRTSNTTLEGASDQFFRGRVVFPGTMSRDRQLLSTRCHEL